MSSAAKFPGSVRSRLASDEKVLGSFLGYMGPPAGVEAFAVLAFGAVLIVTGWYLVAALVAIAMFVGVQRSRNFTTVVRTDRQLLLIDTGRRRRLSEHVQVSTYPPNTPISVSDRAGDPVVTVGPDRLRVLWGDRDEARRLSRITS